MVLRTMAALGAEDEAALGAEWFGESLDTPKIYFGMFFETAFGLADGFWCARAQRTQCTPRACAHAHGAHGHACAHECAHRSTHAPECTHTRAHARVQPCVRHGRSQCAQAALPSDRRWRSRLLRDCAVADTRVLRDCSTEIEAEAYVSFLSTLELEVPSSGCSFGRHRRRSAFACCAPGNPNGSIVEAVGLEMTALHSSVSRRASATCLSVATRLSVPTRLSVATCLSVATRCDAADNVRQHAATQGWAQ
jgi:hypothetical protein